MEPKHAYLEIYAPQNFFNPKVFRGEAEPVVVVLRSNKQLLKAKAAERAGDLGGGRRGARMLFTLFTLFTLLAYLNYTLQTPSRSTGLFRLFRLLASLNYTRRTPLQARSPVIVHSRTRFVARAPSTANSPADGVEISQADSLAIVGYGSQGGRRAVTPASTRLRPKAMCDSGRVRGTTMCVSTPLCEKQ